MNLSKLRQIQISVMPLLCVLTFVACGPKNSGTDSGSTDSASLGDRNDTTLPQAICNRVTDGNLDLKLMEYKDIGGNKNSSMIRMKLLRVPDEFMSDGWDIHIRKWTASKSGDVKPAINEEPYYPLAKIEYNSGSGYTSISQWEFNGGAEGCASCANIDWTNMKQMAATKGLTYTSANAYFANFTLLIDLEDPNGDWKALQILFRKDGQTQKFANILIPTFEADPADYIKTHPKVLSDIHPFIGMLNKDWDASEFQTMANGNCF